MWSGAARSTPINDKTDRKEAFRLAHGHPEDKAERPPPLDRTVRELLRRAWSTGRRRAPRVRGVGREPQRHVPRWTKACSYADQFPTRSFVLYFGWTFDLMSRSCTRSGHRGVVYVKLCNFRFMAEGVIG